MATFLDNLLEPIRRRRVSPTQTVGVGGQRVFGGYPDQQEQDQQLRGRTRYKTYSDILVNTSIVAAGTRYFLNLVAKADWRVAPPEDSGEMGERYAEAVEYMMSNMNTPWHRVIRRAGMYRFYGFSVQEWTAQRAPEDDTVPELLRGFFMYKDVEARPQMTVERWDLNTNGGVEGIVQRSPQTQEEIYIPRSKLVYMIDDSIHDGPEGLGLFRHLVEPERRLKRLQTLEMFGYETDLRGIPVGRAPYGELAEALENGTMTEAEIKTALEPVESFVTNHIKNPELGLLLDSLTYSTTDDASRPSGEKKWDMSLLEGNTDPGFDAVANAIIRIQHEMARVLGVEQLLLGGGDTGSFALSKDKTEALYLIVDSSLQELEQTYQQDYLDTIWQLNGWPEDMKPTLKTEALQFRDVEAITASLSEMAKAGAILDPEDPAINEVRDLLGLSDALVVQRDDLSLTDDPDEEPEEPDSTDDNTEDENS